MVFVMKVSLDSKVLSSEILQKKKVSVVCIDKISKIRTLFECQNLIARQKHHTN